MKKLLILSIAVFTLFSCSDNDEKIIDPIIGSWQDQQEPRANMVPDSCWEMNTYNWNEDFSMTDTEYNDEGNGCVANETDSFATWKNNNDGTYTFNYERRKALRSAKKADEPEEVVTVTFSNNNNTMTHSYEGEDYEEVYTRAE